MGWKSNIYKGGDRRRPALTWGPLPDNPAPGWWWTRRGVGSEAIVLLFRDRDRVLMARLAGGEEPVSVEELMLELPDIEWAGPLEPPP